VLISAVADHAFEFEEMTPCTLKSWTAVRFVVSQVRSMLFKGQAHEEITNGLYIYLHVLILGSEVCESWTNHPMEFGPYCRPFGHSWLG
jgi:hypothetical protein